MAVTDQLHRITVNRCCGIQIPHMAHTFYRDAGLYMGSAIYNCPGWTYAHIFNEVREHGGGVVGSPTKSTGEDA